MPLWRRRSAAYKLAGPLLLRVQNPPDVGDEPVVLDEGLEIQLLAVQTDDGRSAIPAFTSEDELLAWDPDGGPFVALESRAAAAIVYAGGFDVLIVDPASSSWAFPRDQLAALLDAE